MQSDIYSLLQEIPTENYLQTTVSSMLRQNGSNIGTAVGIAIGLLTEAWDDSEEDE